MQNTIQYSVPKIKCDGCRETIEDALNHLEGVHNVSVNVPAKEVTVQYEEETIQPPRLREALVQAGFPPS